ncbi:MAG: hypothetical protein H7A24_01845 [Leptospiraceae bacterium]|nr:hypothetical protein [Leptospiraceae bacterium]MCP5510592.1 hypothetical protein [Leptospiraceae bacterium]
MKKLLSITILLFGTQLFSAPMYVQSPVAQLLDKPAANAKGTLLPKGSVVTKTGEKDMFIQVSYDGKDGWVNKLFLSDKPPSKKVSFGAEIDKSTSVKARARASAFTQTAAARGYSESQNLRTRGGAADYDMEAISWLEKIEINEADLEEFQK